jgi:putative ABC transport system substrate-binding protein
MLVEYRWADGHIDRVPAFAADLVRRQVVVIVALTTPSALYANPATQTIPVVFRVAGDPVEIGLVASFNRPAGNLTGVANLSADITAKACSASSSITRASGIGRGTSQTFRARSWRRRWKRCCAE